MNRYAVRIGSVLALALSMMLCAAAANAADNTYIYNGRRIVFQTLTVRPAGPAVSADDPGLRALVGAKGATLTWDATNQYVLITFPGPIVISFAIGDPHYLVGSVTETAAFAPFLHDNHAYVPLNDVLRALKLPPLSATVSPTAAPATPLPLASAELAPPPTPTPVATPMPSPQPVQVTAVDVQTQPGTVTIRIAVSGDGAYDWHRLRPPDNRWWIDIHGARLVIPPTDQTAGDPVTAVRTRQQSGDAVRIALSLSDFDQVDVAPNDGSITITVTNRKLADAPRSGTGTFGSNAVAQASPVVSPTSRYVPTNPNLIVIDPGHGGSDPGAGRRDSQEKVLTLDMARRVRDILVARGWQVVLTRETDRDVYAANDSARDELQARDDVANSQGARLLISIHVNSYVNSGPHGVTTFYFKPEDFALAQAVNRRVISELGIKNNGVIKNKFYVINHANMPAALIETAFISNPDDLALLQSSTWRQKMAQAIADGIVDYTESN